MWGYVYPIMNNFHGEASCTSPINREGSIHQQWRNTPTNVYMKLIGALTLSYLTNADLERPYQGGNDALTVSVIEYIRDILR